MKKKIFTLLLTLLISCLANQSVQGEQAMSLLQSANNENIIIRANVANNRIRSVDFPFSFRFTNHSSGKARIARVSYYYNRNYKPYLTRAFGGWNTNDMQINQIKGDSLINKGSGAWIMLDNISNSEYQDFIIYVSLPVDTAAAIQSKLMPYLEQIKQRGTTQRFDTLSVGTFSEFRARHPELVKNLLRGDSIEFIISGHGEDFYCPRRMALDTTIVLPIETFFMHIEE